MTIPGSEAPPAATPKAILQDGNSSVTIDDPGTETYEYEGVTYTRISGTPGLIPALYIRANT